MALKIKVKTASATGFEAAKAFIFLDFYFLRNQTWVNLTYFESQSAFKQNKDSYIPSGLPSQIQLSINKNEFWGNQLITLIHKACISELEKVVGVGNIEIIQDPNT